MKLKNKKKDFLLCWKYFYFYEKLLGRILAGKGVVRAGDEAVVKRQGRGFIRAGYGSKKGVLMLPQPLINYQNEPRFNGVYSRDNLQEKIKDGIYIINLDEYSDVGSHWIALYALSNNVTYFHSFDVEHILKEIKKFNGNRNIETYIFEIQALKHKY